MTHDTATLVDAHVHLHVSFPLEILLDRAASNFDAAARATGSSSSESVLLLAQTPACQPFDLLTGGDKAIAGWRVETTGESCSVRARRSQRDPRDHRSLLIIAGRQLACAEGLEVLALATDAALADGASVRETLHAASEAGALTVMPWGFGKWLGRRGRLVGELLADNRLPDFALGDNSARPAFWVRPPLFDTAQRMGRHVLPGSDPLPFPREVGRAGSFGFVLPAALDARYPARSLVAALATTPPPLRAFGALEGTVRCLRNQLRMQWFKRRAA